MTHPDDCWHTEIEKSRCVHCGTICAPSIPAYTLADPPPRDAVEWVKCFGGEVRIIGTHVVPNPTDVP
jgi:hypothetical protein